MDLDAYLIDQPPDYAIVLSRYVWPIVPAKREIWFWGLDLAEDMTYRSIHQAAYVTGGICLYLDQVLEPGWDRNLVIHPVYADVFVFGTSALSPALDYEDARRRFTHNMCLHRRTYGLEA